jgi:hypothetical protein
MISRRLGYSFIYSVIVVVVGCGRTPGSSSVGPNGNVPRAADDATILAATLSTLNLSNPVADLDANLARGDRRFVGLYGINCSPPDLNASFDGVVARFGTRCLPGTSDAIESPKHAALIDSARRYANAYNWELLHRIRDGRVS